jgi:D-alanyl-D-alanine endopeptidase (penicillin-binding protein 7)
MSTWRREAASRLRVGTELSRGELLHLALMSSENRAANALGRSYPGGLPVFVSMMNARAKMLGMADTRYVEPTGLSSKNQSSARDLATLVNFASGDPLCVSSRLLLASSRCWPSHFAIQQYEPSGEKSCLGNRPAENGLHIRSGQCLVMQAKVAGRKLIMVFLDSAGKLSRLADAERVKRWVESIPAPVVKATRPLASAPSDHRVVAN